MKFLKKYELFQDFESEDYVIALPTFPLYSDNGLNWKPKKDFVTTNVGLVMDRTREMIKIEYKTNPNSIKNGYILNSKNELVTFKKYFRLATEEEIEEYKLKNSMNKYNL